MTERSSQTSHDTDRTARVRTRRVQPWWVAGTAGVVALAEVLSSCTSSSGGGDGSSGAIENPSCTVTWQQDSMTHTQANFKVNFSGVDSPPPGTTYDTSQVTYNFGDGVTTTTDTGTEHDYGKYGTFTVKASFNETSEHNVGTKARPIAGYTTSPVNCTALTFTLKP